MAHGQCLRPDADSERYDGDACSTGAVFCDGKIWVGKGEDHAWLTLAFGNRHGLITGATGTGKTASLQVLAEGFSRAGVPVFATDIKGDLSGIAVRSHVKPNLCKRARELGYDYAPEEFPIVFWDLFGERGHPFRATILEMGPVFVSRMLRLNDVQAGIINIAFRFAQDDPVLQAIDSNGLVDLKDLREVLAHLAVNARTNRPLYGNVAISTIKAVQRQLMILENQGATEFFGEPGLDIIDLMRVDSTSSRGIINVVAADRLITNPRLYATVLLWLLKQLHEQLRDIGDPPKPQLVLFLDEAQLLLRGANQALTNEIEFLLRSIRCRGAGVFFITGHASDVPDRIRQQLGNQIHHALRVSRSNCQSAAKAITPMFPSNSDLDIPRTITELEIGEALVSFLGQGGVPSHVKRIKIRPPAALLGAVSAQERLR